jgi:molybdopterin/thiamine biosynthesis adenylyltransferase
VTIVDSSPVTEQDLGNNFFLESAGSSRASATVQFLKELNEDVITSFVEDVLLTSLMAELGNPGLKQYRILFRIYPCRMC